MCGVGMRLNIMLVAWLYCVHACTVYSAMFDIDTTCSVTVLGVLFWKKINPPTKSDLACRLAESRILDLWRLTRKDGTFPACDLLTYYASICSYARRYLLGLKLCQHNSPMPTCYTYSVLDFIVRPRSLVCITHRWQQQVNRSVLALQLTCTYSLHCMG